MPAVPTDGLLLCGAVDLAAGGGTLGAVGIVLAGGLMTALSVNKTKVK